MKNGRASNRRFLEKIKSLESELLKRQIARANSLVKNKKLIFVVRRFRKEFEKIGFPRGGFFYESQRNKWLSHLADDKKVVFERELKKTIKIALILGAYSTKWISVIKHFIYFNKPLPLYIRDCDYTWDFDEEEGLWRFNISGYNAIPSAVEIECIRLILENEFKWRREQYHSDISLIREELRKMEQKRIEKRVKGYAFGPSSYKELSVSLAKKFGKEIKVSGLEKINQRRKVGQKTAKNTKKH